MRPNVGDWIRFYTNSTRPNTTKIGKVIEIKRDETIVVQNAVMRYWVTQSDITEVLEAQHERQ